jgi:hypothetical protein
MNRQVPCLLAVLHLEEEQSVHLLGILVIKELPLQVPHHRAVPGELLLAS